MLLRCAEHFDGVDEGLQPDKDGPPGPPIRIVLYPATPNLLIKIPRPASSYPVRAEHNASMANISSRQLLEDAPPTSMGSDPMDDNQGLPDSLTDLFLHSLDKVRDDQNEGLPDYLADFFLHSPGKIGHMSQNPLEVPSQEDWACTYPKRLEEAQTESSGLSVQGAASCWSVSCSQSDIQQGESDTLSSFFVGSSLTAEKQVYGMQDEGVTLGCTNGCARNETLASMSAPGQAEQTWRSQWDSLQCTTIFDNTLSYNEHGIARQHVRSDSVPWFATAASGISMSSSSHFDSHPQDMNHCPLGEMDLHFVR